MNALTTFIICLAIFGSTCVICYTMYIILTNKSFIIHLHDYLVKRGREDE